MLPRNLCELLLRDLASLLATSRQLNQSLRNLRPRCGFSSDLTVVIDSMVSLRLVAHHLELKIRLAAESALLAGPDVLCRTLMTWAAEWDRCGRMLRSITVRARAVAYIADLDNAGGAPAT